MAGTPEAGVRETASGQAEPGGDTGGGTGENAGENSASVASPRRWRSWLSTQGGRTALVVAGVSCVVVIPMLIAAWGLGHPKWLPLAELAQIELRVRDVGLDNPPLLGPVGRFEGYGEHGAHPGPLMFYVLAPMYRLFGADGNALLVSSVFVSSVASALAIWIGHRRGGWRFAVAVAIVLGLLVRNYGAWRLAEPWNPHMPLIWWFVVLLAVWSVLCDDLPMLPVAAFAGVLCAQTHIAYMTLDLGLGALVGAYLVLRSARSREPDSDFRRRVLLWGSGAVGLFVLLWLPPLVEQIRHDPGNLSILVENFRHPDASPATFGKGVSFWAERLDARQLFTSTLDTSNLDPDGSAVAGYLFLGLWGLAAGVSLRRRDPALLRLHLTVAAALTLGLMAISRIVGPMWTYLGLWMWGVCALMLLAIAWSVLTLAMPRATDGPGTPLDVAMPVQPGPSAAFLTGAAVAVGILFSIDAARADMPSEARSTQLRELVETTVAGLNEDPAGCDNDCRYLVTWADSYYFGAQGFGMLAELERRGFDARATSDIGLDNIETGIGRHRRIDAAHADAEVHVAVGVEEIDLARAKPGSTELAYIDPNTPEEQTEYRRARRELVRKLEAEGYDDEATNAAREPYSQLPVDSDMSPELRRMSFFLNNFEKPVATFVIVASP